MVPQRGLELAVVLLADSQAGATDRGHPRARGRVVDLHAVAGGLVVRVLVTAVAGGEEEADALARADLEHRS